MPKDLQVRIDLDKQFPNKRKLVLRILKSTLKNSFQTSKYDRYWLKEGPQREATGQFCYFEGLVIRFILNDNQVFSK